jgi:Zn-finger nucleic acid-binding protein
MQCPRCQVVGLHTGEAETMTVHACGRCGGVWLGPDDAARLLRWVTVQPWQEPVQVACPICRGTMHGKYVAEANVVVDECTGHGLWFDRYEMEHVAAAVARKRGRPAPEFPAYAVAGAALAGVAAASAVTAALLAGDDPPPEPEDDYAADVAVEAVVFAPEIAEGGAYVGAAVVDSAAAVDVAGAAADVAGGAAEAAGGVFEAIAEILGGLAS